MAVLTSPNPSRTLTDIDAFRLMLFGLLGLGLALILVGVVSPSFTEAQKKAWLTEAERDDPNINRVTTKLLTRMNFGIRVFGFGVGTLTVVLSGTSIWILGRKSRPESTPGSPDRPPSTPRSSGLQIPKLLGLGISFLGLILSLWGQQLERDSFRPREQPEIFTGNPSLSERQFASEIKALAVLLVLLGPVVWLIAHRVISRRSGSTESS